MLGAYLSALFLGALHALEVDHMVAVGAFIGGRPKIAESIGFGVRWGVGHSVAVMVVGGAIAALSLDVPESINVWGERLVGVALIALGIWAFRRAGRLHLHRPADHGDHAHLHAHPEAAQSHRHGHEHVDSGKHHRHGSTLVGAVHGLAGSAPVVALIPVALMDNLVSAFGYLLAFGVGTIAAMALFAAVASFAVSGIGRSLQTLRMIARLMAVASGCVGVWWLVR